MNGNLIKRSLPSLQLSLIYVVFSSGWILLSDQLVTEMGYTAEVSERVQNAKGLLFVFSSALILYVVSRTLYARIQKNLLEKETLVQKLTALNEAAKEAIADYDFTTDSAFVNDQMLKYLNVGTGRIKNFAAVHHSHFHPDDLGPVMEEFEKFARSNGKIWQTSYRYRNQEGVYRDIIGRGYIVRQPGTGKPLHMMYAMQDVTDLKDANAKCYLQEIQHRQQIAQSILKAQDTERNRWAQELHDNVCQVLTVAQLCLQQGLTEQSPGTMQRQSLAMMQKALDDIRQLSTLIKPPEFLVSTLSDSINNLLNNVQRFSKTNFELYLQPEAEDGMQEEQKRMVYRVVQEQLTNILKYAEASTVRVAVQLRHKEICVTVKDNGKGFDPLAVKTGIGLKNMQDRLLAVGGRLTVISAPQKGCEVQALFSV